MTDPTSASAPVPPAPAWRPLAARERRVLGVLVEKAKTTPAGYPMSVNAIVAGCNQKNNRHPLTSYDEQDIEDALRQLGALGVVSEIDWMGRVPKYKHHAYDWLGVNKAELAVLTELLLRGAQAIGELRGRAARMEPIADIAALRPIVNALVERRLMIELTTHGRGQVVSHNLYLPSELQELKSGGGMAPRETTHEAADAAAPVSAARPSSVPELAAMAAELGELRAEVTRLGERVRELENRIEDSRD